MSKLSPQILKLAKQASQLEIDQNQLTHLDEDLIGSCTNLQTLSMMNSCSPDTKFSFGFLTSLTKLTQLEITLPEGPADFGVFQTLKLLTTLILRGVSNIDDNKTKSSKLNKDAFDQLAKMPALETLDLSCFEINSLDQDMFAGFEKLKTLSLEDNRICRVHVEAFNNCPSHLGMLLLCDNQITSLEPGLFATQKHLGVLDFSNNCLNNLTPGVFDGLEGLRTLSLDQNKIEDLPTGIFRSLDKLSSVSLHSNSISAIKCGVFDEMVNLDYLILNKNPLTTIEPGLFQQLASLTRLSLDQCQLKSINDRMFTGLVNLIGLGLSNNHISSVEIVNEPEAIRLDKANLSPLELEAVRNSLFKDMANLRSLSLNGNRLEKLDLNVFCNLRNLQVLDLSGNAINELNSSSTEHNLAMLQTLNLKGNKLITMSKNAFSSAINLRYVDLSENKLDTLDTDFFSQFPGLNKLNLENNNLRFNVTRSSFSEGGRQLNQILLAHNNLVQIEDEAFHQMHSIFQLRMDLSASFTISSVESPLHDTTNGFAVISLQKSTAETLKRFLDCNKQSLRSSRETLQSLEFKNSSLVTLDGFDLGVRFIYLRKLNLSGNQLKELKASWFESLEYLLDLDVSSNCLEQLDDPNLFQQLPVTDVNLSHNKLTHVNRYLFRGLIRLRSIDLSANPQLGNIDPSFFRGLASLSTVKINGNNIKGLSLEGFHKFCPNLEKLDI